MSHPFGDLLSQYRAHKHRFSQTRLAHLAGYDPAVLVRMCQGKKDLTGPSGRDRILRIINVLHSEGVLKMQAEANALLEAAAMPPLYAGQSAEAALLAKLNGKQADSKPSSFSHKSNLPHPLTPLMGREADAAEVKRWLAQPEVRVLTLIGPPGVGRGSGRRGLGDAQQPARQKLDPERRRGERRVALHAAGTVARVCAGEVGSVRRG